MGLGSLTTQRYISILLWQGHSAQHHRNRQTSKFQGTGNFRDMTDLIIPTWHILFLSVYRSCPPRILQVHTGGNSKFRETEQKYHNYDYDSMGSTVLSMSLLMARRWGIVKEAETQQSLMSLISSTGQEQMIYSFVFINGQIVRTSKIKISGGCLVICS